MKKLVIATFCFRVCQIVLLGLSTALVARGLGVELRGIYGLAIWMPMILGIVGQFGQASVNNIFPGRYSHFRSQIVYNNFIFVLISAVLCLGFYFFFFYQFPWSIGKFTQLSHGLVLLSALWIPLLLAENLFRELARGCEFIIQTAFITTLSNAIRLLAVIVFVFVLQGEVLGAILAMIIPSFMAILGYLFLIRRYISFTRFSGKLFWKSCRFGFTFMIGTAAISLLIQMPLFVLSMYQVSDFLLGLYSFAILLASQAQNVPIIISQVFLPRLSNNLGEISPQTSQIFRLSLIACVLVGLSMSLLSYPCIYIVAGSDYIACLPCFLILVFGITLFGSIRVLGMYLWAHQKQHITTRNNVISLFIVILISLLLIPYWSILGAAVAITVGYLGLTVLTIVSYLHESKVGWRSLIVTASDLHCIRKTLQESINFVFVAVHTIFCRLKHKVVVSFLK